MDYENVLASPGGAQMAAWTLRLADSELFRWLLVTDPHLFAMHYASCSSAVPPPQDMLPAGTRAVEPEGGASDKLLATIKELRRHFGEQASGHFARLYLEGMSAFETFSRDTDAYQGFIKEWRKLADSEANTSLTSLEENIDRLVKLLGLGTLERDLFYFQMNRHRPGFAQLYDVLLSSDEISQAVLAAVLDQPTARVREVLEEDSRLVSSGLLQVQERPLRIEIPSSHLRAVVTEIAPSDEAFISRFVQPLEPAPTTGSLARLHDYDRDILLTLMRRSLPNDGGLHALVYGPKSVDKRDMLARLFLDQEIEAYAVVAKHVPAQDVPVWTFIAQRHIAKEHPTAVLVVGRADQSLASRTISLMSMFGMVDEEAPSEDGRASDAGLTDARVRCVWMTDRPGFLTERNLGRFLFHCEALPGSRADRRERINSVISEFQLSKDLELHLSKYSLLGDQQVRQAARLAKLIARKPEDRDRVIRRAVHQSQRALGRDRTEELRDSVTKYSLDYLNISGKFTPDQIIGALRKKPHGTLCFYGIPGAGKTQLAEYMALELDKPIVMKRASDLLSKWVGENEQNIAGMFEEATSEGAILFLDEADSFLRDRSLARAEWSVTQVNELLQQMERFPGVFIAATNLFKSLDAAALRRFTWKLEFLALRPDQAWTMFQNETGFNPAKAKAAETTQLQDGLDAIKHLTPGDFATVKRQANMLDEHLSPEEWLDQLALETKAKMAGIERNGIGFGSEL